jgi:hypothetical protein
MSETLCTCRDGILTYWMVVLLGGNLLLLELEKWGQKSLRCNYT